MECITFRITLLLSLLVMVFTSAFTWAKGEGPAASADMGLYTKYVWRGWELSDDSTVFQPSAGIGYKGFGFNMWGNLDTEYMSSENSDLNEIDLTLDYSFNIGPVDLGLGYIYYGFEGDDSKEIYVSATYDILLAPTLTVYRDIDLFPGYYSSLGISHSIPLSSKVSLGLSGSLGYYDDNTGYSSLHDGLVSAGLSISFNDYLALSPSLSYSFALSDKAEEKLANDEGESDFVYGGIALSVAF